MHCDQLALLVNMPGTRSNPISDSAEAASVSDPESVPVCLHDDEHLVLCFMAVLKQPDVLAQLKQALFPQQLSGQLDQLQSTTDRITDQLKHKDATITALELRVSDLELQVDSSRAIHPTSQSEDPGHPRGHRLGRHLSQGPRCVQ